MLFSLFGTVLGPTLFTIRDANGVKGSSNNMIPYTRQVFDTTTPYQHDRMLLKIMANPRDICDDLQAIGQPDLRNLSER